MVSLKVDSAIISVPQTKMQYNGCNLGGNTSTRESLSDMAWKIPDERDVCHRFLKQSVVTSIPPLFFKTVNDYKDTKPDHFANCARISPSFGYFLVYYDIRIPGINSLPSSQ